VHKSTRIILLLTLLIWLGACEFKLPTTPSLPSKWNSNLVLPLLDKSYTFADLVSAASGNPFSADTNGVIWFAASDSTSEPITIDPALFCVMPGADVSTTLDLRKYIQRNADSTVNVISFSMKAAWDEANNRVAFGVLDNAAGFSADGLPLNALVLTAQLNDSFPNAIRIRVTAQNFHGNPGSAVVIDSLDLPAGWLSDSLTIPLAGDSLVGGSLTAGIDSLSFSIQAQVLGKLPVAASRLKQKLTTRITIGRLQMDSFYGRIFATGEAPPELIENSLSGANEIFFDSARAEVTISDAGGAFDSVHVCLSGRKVHGSATWIDTTLAIETADFSMDAAEVMSNLPDTIRVFVKAMSLPGIFQQGMAFASGVDVKYSLSVPMVLIIPAELTLASGQTTTYFIRASTTRAKITKSQQGAELDMSVENRTQLQGWLYFLISNFNFFPFDTLADNLPAGYVCINDTIWHQADDTVRVQIDTLAALEFAAAQFSGDTLISAGIMSQTFFADSAALGALADTCYFKPYFKLVNPDTTRTTITNTQSLSVRSYLNLFFDASALND